MEWLENNGFRKVSSSIPFKAVVSIVLITNTSTMFTEVVDFVTSSTFPTATSSQRTNFHSKVGDNVDI